MANFQEVKNPDPLYINVTNLSVFCPIVPSHMAAMSHRGRFKCTFKQLKLRFHFLRLNSDILGAQGSHMTGITAIGHAGIVYFHHHIKPYCRGMF